MPPFLSPIHDANSRITSLLYCAEKLVSLCLHDTVGVVEAVDEVRRGRAARERQPVADDHGLFTGGIG